MGYDRNTPAAAGSYRNCDNRNFFLNSNYLVLLNVLRQTFFFLLKNAVCNIGDTRGYELLWST